MINSVVKLPQLSQFDSTNVNAASRGTIATIPAGSTTNIDIKLLDDSFLTGGVLRAKGATFGDYATFQVVDVDNVLESGYGAILGEYVTNWYMRSDSQEQVNENTHYPAKIKANLYLRLIYVSIGVTNVDVAIMYRLHKALF